MASILSCETQDIALDAKLTELVDNSFTLVELIIELQEVYGIRFGQADMKGIQTVDELLNVFNVQ
ncbi:acyl carrier protein [Thalassotalea sp. HSM 43]|nr:acyl carrier protein [Thalassotalea sp. HSM 43]